MQYRGRPPSPSSVTNSGTGRLGKRADIVGLPVRINGNPASIIGVLPERFAIVYPRDLYMPLAPPSELESWAIGRLKADATLEEARAQLDTITRQLEAANGVARGEPLVRTYTQFYVAADAPRIYGALWGWCMVGAADRLRQSHQPDTRPNNRPVARIHDPRRARRRPAPNGATDADREPGAHGRGDGDRLADYQLEREEVGGRHRLSLPGARLLHHLRDAGLSNVDLPSPPRWRSRHCRSRA